MSNVPQRSHGAMIEVMLQVGEQLVKSIISLPTPTFAHMVSFGIPRAIGMGKEVLALEDRGKFSVGRF